MYGLNVFNLVTRRPPGSTLFPYTTLVRSYALSKARIAAGTECAAGLWTITPRSSWTNPYRVVGRNRPTTRYGFVQRSEEHTSELQSQFHLVCRLLLGKKKSSLT